MQYKVWKDNPKLEKNSIKDRTVDPSDRHFATASVPAVDFCKWTHCHCLPTAIKAMWFRGQIDRPALSFYTCATWSQLIFCRQQKLCCMGLCATAFKQGTPMQTATHPHIINHQRNKKPEKRKTWGHCPLVDAAAFLGNRQFIQRQMEPLTFHYPNETLSTVMHGVMVVTLLL